jgi:hypothetical protein
VSKDTSHHAMVWICRLPPFDKDVRVGVPIVVVVIVVVVDLCLVERQPDASFGPCLEGTAHRVAGHILADVIAEITERVRQGATVPGAP